MYLPNTSVKIYRSIVANIYAFFKKNPNIQAKKYQTTNKLLYFYILQAFCVIITDKKQ